MKRLWELDFVRGIAIILMIVFHLGYDLDFTGNISINPDEGMWLVIARIVQVIFILTTGITTMISYNRRIANNKKLAVKSRVIHALKLLSWGLLITLITWVLFKEQAVKFGILHFYSVSILLSLPLLRFKKWNSLIGIGVILLAIPLKEITFESAWLFPLGIEPTGFSSLDYFPLIPWFGLFLQGVAFGVFYKKSPWKRPRIFLKYSKMIEALGKHSLGIYLIHQPIIMGGIYLAERLLAIK
jgi:uncharacterized membrane protein